MNANFQVRHEQHRMQGVHTLLNYRFYLFIFIRIVVGHFQVFLATILLLTDINLIIYKDSQGS